MQEIEHGGRDVVPADAARVIKGLLQGERRHLPERDQALERCHIVDRHPEVAAKPAQVLVREEQDQEWNPIGEKETSAAEHEGGDQHQQQQSLGGDGEMQDEDHEERDGGEIAADHRGELPGGPAA